jgi:formate hydrogenlyase subunit 4
LNPVILSLVAQILHIALMVAVAPALAGLALWLSARRGGRGGPPILAPWRELIRLSRKTPVTVESVSFVARLAPMVSLGATLAAAALVPSFTLTMALAPLADVLVIVALLGVARVATGLAALDSGAAAPGLATQTASARAALAEPALMLAVVALALMGGSTNLYAIIGQQREGLLLPETASALVLTAMLALVLVEASAAGDGLEDMFGGIELAVLRMEAWLRQLVWIDLIGALFFPVGTEAAANPLLAWLIGLAAWGAKLGLFILGLTAIQAAWGRIAPRRLPELAGLAALLALLAIIMVLASAGMA